MTAMNTGRSVQTFGRVMAALAVLAIPMVAAADGPAIRVTRPGAGRVVIEVVDSTVAVRKEMTAGRSVVTITTPKDRLIVTVRRGMLSVSGPDGTMTMGDESGSYERLLGVLQGSEAAAKARVLLAQVTDGPETFVGQSVLLTRAILEAGSGKMDALSQHQQWVSDRATARAGERRGRPVGRPMLIHAAVVDLSQQRGPGECWDLYSREAVRIADDFADCTDDLRWYEAHLWAGCSLIYAVRAEAAMAWFISCNGGIPFNG
jgi:hypothetical protein